METRLYFQSCPNLKISACSLRSLRLRGEEITGQFHRRDAEDAKEAQRKTQIRTLLSTAAKVLLRVTTDDTLNGWKSRRGVVLFLPTQFFENFISSAKTHIERLFAECDSTQFRMSEVNRSIRLCAPPPCPTPDEPGAWTNHGVAPSHYVKAFNQASNIRMCAGKIRERHISPSATISL